MGVRRRNSTESPPRRRLGCPTVVAMGWIAASAAAVAATVGVGSVVVGLNVSASPGGDPAVWIDGPLVGSALEPGEITVSAHATAADRIDHLVLVVDGDEVAESDDLQRSGTLVYATFTWDAAEGEHTLVVEQEGGDVRSSERIVFVGEQATGTPYATPTPTPSASPSASPEASETPSEATETPSPTPEPTEQPSRTPTTEAPVEDPPVISAASTSPGPLRVCEVPGYTVTISARVQKATEVDASFDGRTFSLTNTGASSWSVTVESSTDLDPGTFDVLVEAVGPGGLAALEAGTVTVNPGCPKD